jgi:predicted ATPase
VWGSGDERLFFGDLLRRHRLAARLTQEALAERSRLSTPAIGALERGVRQHPYRVTVGLLADALGLSPPQREEFALAARGRGRPRERSSPAEGHDRRFPAPLTPLIGREAELALAVDALRRPQVRLLTLTGSPGVGKTRLGLAVASALRADFPDGVVFVPLTSLTAPELLGAAINRAIGARQATGHPPLDALVAHVGSRRLLLLLDNFEHLVPAARLVSDLLASCPNLRVLATSRVRLRLRGEYQLHIPPLPVPDVGERAPAALAKLPSVALFVQRAEASSLGFELTSTNAAVVGEVCRRLDGLPLALELAAMQTPLVSPLALLEGLDDRLQVLVGGPLDVPEHQRSMHDSLRWSYGLLSKSEQALFRRLSVFTGGIPADGIEEVCQAAGVLSGSVLELAMALLDNNLVHPEIGDGDLRLGMLETVRAYGHELLVASGEAESTSRQHAAYYLALVEAVDHELEGRDQFASLVRLEREHLNLRAALRWAREAGQVERCARLAERLWRFWARHRRSQAGLGWLAELMAGDGSVGPETGAMALGSPSQRARPKDLARRQVSSRLLQMASIP